MITPSLQPTASRSANLVVDPSPSYRSPAPPKGTPVVNDPSPIGAHYGFGRTTTNNIIPDNLMLNTHEVILPLVWRADGSHQVSETRRASILNAAIAVRERESGGSLTESAADSPTPTRSDESMRHHAKRYLALCDPSRALVSPHSTNSPPS